uniref:Zinc finger MYM-type protein 1-like n=1 Tax=Geotrypetes seraphini TaxID=260995 RepID=A0A6P8Q739_GEOSA|nr:zinc finger MYM-type protein 1-like [Geotrypetes seraphini]XP_033792110.1 zinc finger MYM-type protein 1-like [Geotrypetes seraphini]XP_033792112.1 zinc finger MYM-type protein 1-like [Geotrypetes seraphini]
MSERKRLSGAQYRKRKAEKEKEQVEQASLFLKYLYPERGQEGSSKDQLETEAKMAASRVEVQIEQNLNVKDETIEVRVGENIRVHESGNSSSFSYGDPATWPSLLTPGDDHVRQLLVEHGPEQVQQFDFPKDGNQRKFSTSHYKRRLANGEEVHRRWLLYSVSNDSVFCFCCKLFTTDLAGLSSLSDQGSRDWKNMSAILAAHERSCRHYQNCKKWKDLELVLEKKKKIDEEHLHLIKQEEKYWQQVLERLVALVRVLGMQNLAFQGLHEKLHTVGNGNFLKFVELLSLFDPLMEGYLHKVRDAETHAYYLGKDLQNEMIQMLSSAVKNEILMSAHAAKYFSIILDCTTDAGHFDQMSIVLRFVDVTSDTDNCKPISIKEHFLGFVPLREASGAGMMDIILHLLEEMSLPIENLRGQGYDNGSNMRGKENGVQRKILDINPRAMFVPCSAHSLKLIVSDAAMCCLEATIFFDLVQRMFVYFSASTHRWRVLMRHIPNITVKPLRETRWESHIHALKLLRNQLGDVYDALIEIADDSTLSGSSGNASRIDAQTLAKGISSFRFVVSLVVWHDILFEINRTSKQLQANELDIQNAIQQLRETEKFLVDRRTDEGFEKSLLDARELAEELEIPVHLEPVRMCMRRKRKQFKLEADGEPIQNAEEKFKVDFYFAILDAAIQSVDERFTQMHQISSVFGFLYDVHGLQNRTPKQILEHCLILEHALHHGDSKDIDASDLCNELRLIAKRIPKGASPQDVLNFICKYQLPECFPNTFIALRILLTLPVFVASGDQSFSKLNLIKTYICSTVVQETLDGLAVLSMEHETAQKIDLEKLVSAFAKLKAQKVAHLNSNLYFI